MASQPTSTEVEAIPDQTFRWELGGGILLALLGLVALLTPVLTGVALTVLIGGLLVVGALVHVAAAFSAGSFWGVVWQILLGIIYGFAGISILANPVLGLASLSLLVMAFLLVEGVVQLVWAVTVGEGSRLWFGLSGVISLVLFGMLWTGFPVSALWIVGVIFGVDLLFTGLAMILQARHQRALVKQRNEEQTSTETAG